MNIEAHNDDLPSESDVESRKRFTFEENSSAFSEKIFQRPNFKIIALTRSNYLICTFIVSLIIGIIVIMVCVGQTDPEPDDKLNLLRSLVISNDSSVWLLDVDQHKYTALRTTNKNKILALDVFSDKSVFWAENDTWRFDSLTGIVNYTRRWRPQAVAVDYVTEKLYLVDKRSGSLSVLDTYGHHWRVLTSNLEEPLDLVLDPAEGFVFVAARYQIIRANMDGSSMKDLEVGPFNLAIAIDRKATKLYYTQSFLGIQSSDYDGKNRVHIHHDVHPMEIISLAVFENRLYWVRFVNSSADTCPCTNVLYSCTIFRRSCTEVTSTRLPFDKPRIVRSSFDQFRQLHAKHNPCRENNGGCDHLCLMTSKNSHGCACSTGWSLAKDGRTCHNVTSMLMYSERNLFKASVLDEEPHGDAIVPSEFRVGNLTKKPHVHFDYDMVSGNVYFSDDHSIYRMNLLKDDEQTTLLNAGASHVIRDLAYDWFKNCLYYIKESQDPASNHSIEMLGLGKSQQRTVLSVRYRKEHYLDSPFFLLVHPSREYLFYTSFTGIQDNLQRIGTSGRGQRLIKALYDGMYTLLSLDLEKSRLYLSTTADPGMIRSANLDGSEERGMKVNAVKNVTAIAAYRNWLYLSDDDGSGWSKVWRVDPSNNESAIFRSTIFGTQGLRVFSMAARNAE